MADNNNNDDEYNFFRLITLGDSGVGKTSLLKRFTNKKYDENTITSLGFGSTIKDFTLKDGTKIRLKLIDTMGQENYKSIAKSYIRNADGVFFVFAHDNRESFYNIINWLIDFKDNNLNINKNNSTIPAILLGNKCDLEHIINDDEIEEIIEENKFYKYINTSAKDNIGVNEALEEIGKMLYHIYGKRRNIHKLVVSKHKKITKMRKCCESQL